MSEVKCPQCGAPLDPGASECKYCGEKVAVAYEPQPQPQAQSQYQQQPYQQQPYQQQSPYNYGTTIDPNWPIKSKVAAAILAIVLGGIGVQFFYLGKIVPGILCVLFCWTGIPSLIGFIQGIIMLCGSDQAFMEKYRVRI